MSIEKNILEEDLLRADMYEFISNLLKVEPTEDFVEMISKLQTDDTGIGKNIQTLSLLAKKMSVSQIKEEYFSLFIGVGRGEFLPYASYYLTGFLNENLLQI